MIITGLARHGQHISGGDMGWFERWKTKHLVEENTPVSQLSAGARSELLANLEEVSAAQGDVQSMTNLGLLAEKRGSLDEAIRWYTMAADAGDSRSMVFLAHAYSQKGHLEQTLLWFKKAADVGNSDAMFNLGNHYSRQGDHTLAIDWYRRAADAGDSDAMGRIGNFYLERGNDIEAVQWYTRAAALGNENAAQVGKILQSAIAGDSDSMLALGGIAAQTERFELAVRWIKKAASAGDDLEAPYDLGVIYQRQGDNARAAHWYMQAADAGYPAALTGLMSVVDQAQFLDWLEKATRAQNPLAHAFLDSLKD